MPGLVNNSQTDTLVMNSVPIPPGAKTNPFKFTWPDSTSMAVDAGGRTTINILTDQSGELEIPTMPQAPTHRALGVLWNIQETARKLRLPFVGFPIVFSKLNGTTVRGTAWIKKCPDEGSDVEAEEVSWIFTIADATRTFGTAIPGGLL